jgi:taurine dioxygenase
LGHTSELYAVKFDLDQYRHITVHPVNGVIGAEIGGVDASGLQPAAAEELRKALSQFHVLFLRDQQLDIPQFAAFAECFGAIGISPLAGNGLSKLDMVASMAREADVPGNVRNNGDRWHTDRAHDECPPKGFLLYCEEAPDYGGDTLFASLCQAYDALPLHLQKRCATLTGIHSMAGVLDVDGKSRADRQTIDGETRRADWVDPVKYEYVRKETEHPLVCRHPETGRPYLFVSGAYLMRIKELDLAEGLELIDQLNRHAVRPEFTCRFRWRKGSVAILDNRVTQHYAVNDYAGFARRMLRAELQGNWRPERLALVPS